MSKTWTSGRLHDIKFMSNTFPTNLLPSKPSVNSDSIHLHTYLPATFGPGTCPTFQLYLAGIHCLWANKHNSKNAAALNILLDLVLTPCISSLLKSFRMSAVFLLQCSILLRSTTDLTLVHFSLVCLSGLFSFHCIYIFIQSTLQ